MADRHNLETELREGNKLDEGLNIKHMLFMELTQILLVRSLPLLQVGGKVRRPIVVWLTVDGQEIPMEGCCVSNFISHQGAAVSTK